MTTSLVALAVSLTLTGSGPLDEDAIRQASLDYVAGFFSADLERIERGVHPSLQKAIVRKGAGDREVLSFMDRHTVVEYARGNGARGAARRGGGRRGRSPAPVHRPGWPAPLPAGPGHVTSSARRDVAVTRAATDPGAAPPARRAPTGA